MLSVIKNFKQLHSFSLNIICRNFYFYVKKYSIIPDIFLAVEIIVGLLFLFTFKQF